MLNIEGYEGILDILEGIQKTQEKRDAFKNTIQESMLIDSEIARIKAELEAERAEKHLKQESK